MTVTNDNKSKCAYCGKEEELISDLCEECYDQSTENHAMETRDLHFD